MSRPLVQTLHEQRELCLEWMSVCDYSSQTIRTYNLALMAFGDWVENQMRLQNLSDITTPVLQEYMVYLSLRGSKSTRRGPEKKLLTAATKLGHLAALLKYFDHLVKQGLLLTNPSLALERPRKRRPLPRSILTVEEIFKLLAAVQGTGPLELRNRAALELLYTTGMRRGELESLTLESPRFDERLVLIRGKGDRERLVPLGQQAVSTLQEYLVHGRPKMLPKGSSALFLSYRGGPVGGASLLRFLRKLAQQVGITKNIDLHSIRHTCATHMLQNGADIRYIQEMLGHVSLQTTMVYTRVETSDLRKMLHECHPREQF